ncbi:hypothetical protein [Mycobacterium sp. 48b]|uniref:hypothetical protein n=1 Tax=Mycobacterium sp. 48b TaxID=3400426 RepID=UPI003AAB10BA
MNQRSSDDEARGGKASGAFRRMNDRIDELVDNPLIAEDVRQYAAQRANRSATDCGSAVLARLLADPERAARIAAIVDSMYGNDSDLPLNNGPITKEEREQMLGYDPDTGV